MKISIQELTHSVRKLCEAGDWGQFHGPRNLATGVINEQSELLEHFRFLAEEQALEL